MLFMNDLSLPPIDYTLFFLGNRFSLSSRGTTRYYRIKYKTVTAAVSVCARAFYNVMSRVPPRIMVRE